MVSTKIRHVISSLVFWISFLLGGGLLLVFILRFTNTELIRNNLGGHVLVLEYGISTMTVVL